MRILYDGEIYRMQPAGGINRYFASIIGGLPADFTPSLLVGERRAVNYPAHPRLKVYFRGRRRLDSISYRLSLLLSRAEDRAVSTLSRGWGFDLAHPTYYTLLTGRDVREYRCPVVLTVWDMIHELFAGTMDPSGRNAEEKRRAMFAADALICISENTKNDLLNRYPALEGKVRVTHLATSLNADMSHGPELIPARPYFLYVGSRSSYKNFGLLIETLSRLATVRPDVGLCVVGEPFSEEERARMTELDVADRIELVKHPSDGHLAKLYRCSVALVYPSLYEGFGIPPLEAMACGTPAIVSGCSSLPEVVGDAGLLFDPRSVEELFGAMLTVFDAPAERERLIAAGLRRARAFSWGQTVAHTRDIYREVGARF
jgi:glycosyltransferase involved in cell wall biosynthesis